MQTTAAAPREDMLADILENVTDLVQSVAPDGSFLYVNRAWLEALGFDAREISSLSLFDVIHPDSRAHCGKMLKQVLAGEDVPHFEATFLAKDGRTLLVEGSSSCRFEDGEPVATRSIFRDITARRQTEDVLRISEEMFRALATHLPVGILRTDSAGNCLYVNERWCELSGSSSQEAMGQGWVEALHPDDRERVGTEWYDSVKTGRRFAREYRFRSKTGAVTWVFGKAGAMTGANGKIDGHVVTTTDITERKLALEALSESERRYRLLVDNSMGLICTHDLDGRLLSVNPAGAQALGYEQSEMVGRGLEDFMTPTLREGFGGYLAEIRESKVSNGLLEVVTKDGRTRIWSFNNALCEEGTSEPYVLGHAQDVTDIKRAENALRVMAMTDELTGLNNRRGFISLAEQRLRASGKRGESGSLWMLYADLDGLKQINDQFGHQEGDRAICEVAAMLRDTFRASDILARLSGDEFAVLIADLHDNAPSIILERLRQKIDKRTTKTDHPYRVSLSAGMIEVTAEAAASLNDLLERADRAMYAHKVSVKSHTPPEPSSQNVEWLDSPHWVSPATR